MKQYNDNDSGMNEAEYFEYLHTPEAFLKWVNEHFPSTMAGIMSDYFGSVGLPADSEIKGL